MLGYDCRRRLNDIWMSCQTEVVVGRDLQVLFTVQFDLGQAVGDGKLTKKNTGIKMISGHFFLSTPKLVTLVKNIWHEKVFCWYEDLKKVDWWVGRWR